MSAPPKGSAPSKKGSMRPPSRPPSRPPCAAPPPSGRASPAESIMSQSSSASKLRSPSQSAGVKRKERDFGHDAIEETNINVVVRCRGRNEREVQENSSVVVSADGIKGNTVELSMGPNSLSNKTYRFDKVFSQAADQEMVFDEVVAPILDQVIAGFNCTIFAYGQTGTGKTYTMSGDISDVLPLPDAAGVIPRVLHYLFNKLDECELENSVKCSFIELYNEELRDLLSSDDSVRLKIFDDAGKKSHSATLVQGVEESHIKTASKGIELLRIGSHKRQVAATKCNDLSSRSHTVYTIMVYIKRTTEDGEDYVSSGKLNLVDLAGSENIQRSGAENKRAAEAGLINKSLLTLGRVINALVEKSSHIPYRESKLTRLLQDSLGGRTKTCIIATLSPAKSNLEETISTLDYAFRAKNIRNKPQMNQLVSKKTLLREFTAEIQSLKSELIATRQRNGVYMTIENYEQITTESESRRILTQEQRDKIETMEANLRNKAQELFSLTSTLNVLKRDNETTRQALDSTKDVMEQTEIALQHTRQNLQEETILRRAHQATENKLAEIGGELIYTLSKTTSDIDEYHAKLRRRSDLHSLNRANWQSSQHMVQDVTEMVEQRIQNFEREQSLMLEQLSSRMQSQLEHELSGVQMSKSFLQEKTQALRGDEQEVHDRMGRAHDNLNEVVTEIEDMREDIKTQVAAGLAGLTAAAQRISAGVVEELEGFHAELHSSYSALGSDFKTAFDDIAKQLQSQRDEAENLRCQLGEAAAALARANEEASRSCELALRQEKQRGASERADLIAQVSAMINKHGETQEQRLEASIQSIKKDVAESGRKFETEKQSLMGSFDRWSVNGRSLEDSALNLREKIKAKIKRDWKQASERNLDIQSTSQAVHSETIRIVDNQVKHMDVQLLALDQILSRVKEQNGQQHKSNVETMSNLTLAVQTAYGQVGSHFDASVGRTQSFIDELSEHTTQLAGALPWLAQTTCEPLSSLRADVAAAQLTEYVATGKTPEKAHYQYPSYLPRTGQTNTLAQKQSELVLSDPGEPDAEDLQGSISPSKAKVFQDKLNGTGSTSRSGSSSPIAGRKVLRPASSNGLKEVNLNIVSSNMKDLSKLRAIKERKEPSGKVASNKGLDRDDVKDFSASVGTRSSRRAQADGRENIPFSASVGAGGGRQLRSRAS